MNQSLKMPRHVAIIMDGNGRWAKQRLMPRVAGHRAGVKSVRRAIDFCARNQISVLSLFALSVENYQNRPPAEVKFLLTLFLDSLVKNLDELHEKRIRICVVGDLSVFDAAVLHQIHQAETLTKQNSGLTLQIAVNYSGRWDILQASQQLSKKLIDEKRLPNTATEKEFASFLCFQNIPEPDLLIRTSGEQRISNFMLWQFAYTELCFVDAFWPDFDDAVFAGAIASFQKRERRFGLTGDQVAEKEVYAED